MTIAAEIEQLRNRIRSFLQVNERVKLSDLRTHLNCTGTNLLMALGGLLSEGSIELKKEGWEIIILITTKP